MKENELAADGHISGHIVDLAVLNRLSSSQRSSVEAHVGLCEQCRVLLDESLRDASDFSRDIFARTLPRMERRVAGPLYWVQFGQWRWVALGGLVTAAAMLFLWKGLSDTAPRVTPQVASAAEANPPPRSANFANYGQADEIQVKGDDVFQVVARRGEQVFAVQKETQLFPNDQIRFVTVSSLPYLLIVSLDGARQVSVYFPFQGDRSGETPLQQRFETPGSVILDDAIGTEHVIALFSAQPILAQSVRRALSGLPQNVSMEQIAGAIAAQVPEARQQTASFEKISQ